MLIDPTNSQGTFIEKVAISLFSFMRRAGLKCTFDKNKDDILSYIFEVRDMTDDGEPFGMAFNVDSKLTAELKDETPETIEQFCHAMTIKAGTVMLEDRCGRLLEHVEKSKLYVPKSSLVS